MRVSLAAVAAALTFSAAPAMALDDDDRFEDALTLEASSDWRLREYPDKCRISRRFGAGEDRVSMWLERGGAEPVFNLTLIGRPFRHPFGAFVSVQFAPEEEYWRNYIATESSRGRPVVSLFGARLTPTTTEESYGEERDEEDDEEELIDFSDSQLGKGDGEEMTPARVAAITELRLGGALIKPIILETGPLTEPMAQLEGCAAELLKTIAENGAGGSSAVPTEIDHWAKIIQENYPRHMLMGEQEGRIGVALNIGTNGRPTYCEVREVVGPTSFNDTVCLLLLKHATFEPARNAQGEPIIGRYSTRVTFRLN